MNHSISSKDVFRFRQFSVKHDKCGMKVGTDGVLIGAWTCWMLRQKNIDEEITVLDVGTGCGLISLMIAQECTHANVTGIDIEDDAVEQARENVAASAFCNNIKIEKVDFNDLQYFSSKYNAIVSNPPFYTENILSGNTSRDNARHTSALSFETLTKHSSHLLAENGDLCIIIPTEYVSNVIADCCAVQLYLSHRVDIKTTLRKAAKRTILHFVKSMQARSVPSSHTTMLMRDETNELTDEYKALTDKFYL